VRITLNIIGVLLLCFGILWILQGLNIVGDGFTTGENKWGLAGIAVLLASILVLTSANRKRT
jgi:uncharacterized membrane protein HdeD (DUF308 family)